MYASVSAAIGAAAFEVMRAEGAGLGDAFGDLVLNIGHGAVFPDLDQMADRVLELRRQLASCRPVAIPTANCVLHILRRCRWPWKVWPSLWTWWTAIVFEPGALSPDGLTAVAGKAQLVQGEQLT